MAIVTNGPVPQVPFDILWRAGRVATAEPDTCRVIWLCTAFARGRVGSSSSSRFPNQTADMPLRMHWAGAAAFTTAQLQDTCTATAFPAAAEAWWIQHLQHPDSPPAAGSDGISGCAPALWLSAQSTQTIACYGDLGIAVYYNTHQVEAASVAQFERQHPPVSPNLTVC